MFYGSGTAMAAFDGPQSVLNRNTQRAAMTLIEVLVVAAIIALLLAILLPSLTKCREQAKRMTCASHLRAFGDSLNFYKTNLGRYPDVDDPDPYGTWGKLGRDNPRKYLDLYSRVDTLHNIKLLGKTWRQWILGESWTAYCPCDPLTPIGPTIAKKAIVQKLKSGVISYIYLSGLRAKDDFKDATGQATFNPSTESPDRTLNHVNSHAVLAGDRTVELAPGQTLKGLPPSNHANGGWFYFTTGDVRWWPENELVPHPSSKITWYWYWPKTTN